MSSNGALTPDQLVRLYEGLEFNVVKASADTKHPVGQWGNRRKRLPTEAQWDSLSRYAERGKPLFLMTGSASDLAILDLDTQQGVELWKRRLGKEWDRIPRVRTPHGYHLYFAIYDDQSIRSINRKRDEGWELKAENTGVVLPSGSDDRVWEVPLGEHLPDVGLIEQWLPKHGPIADEQWDRLDVPAFFEEGISIGERDEKAYRYAKSLISREFKEAEARALMTAAWEKMEQSAQEDFPLEVALEKVARVYRTTKPGRSPGYRKGKEQRTYSINFEAASSIPSERVHWLWENRMAQRSLTVVAGEKGKGKSILTNAWIPARITNGSLDGELKGRVRDVLIVSAEDDWPSMIKPRLKAHGADLDRVHRVRVRDEDGEVFFTLPDHVAILEQQIVQRRDEGRPIGLLVIDPLGAFLSGSTDSYKDASVRHALAPLAQMAERMDLAVIVVMHLTKDRTAALVQRVGGSGAFANAARSVFCLVDDPDTTDHRVLIHAACNWGPEEDSLNLRIVSSKVQLDDGYKQAFGRVVFIGKSPIRPEDVQRGESTSDCAEAILAELQSGPQWSLDVKKAVAKVLGCSMSTVDRAAHQLKEVQGLVIEKHGRQTKWRRNDDDVNDVNDVIDVNDVRDVGSHNVELRHRRHTSRDIRRDAIADMNQNASGEN